jgi:hypothetical protein
METGKTGANEPKEEKAKKIAAERAESGIKFCAYCGCDLDKDKSLHHFRCNSVECKKKQRASLKLDEKRSAEWYNKVKKEGRMELIGEILKDAPMTIMEEDAIRWTELIEKLHKEHGDEGW